MDNDLNICQSINDTVISIINISSHVVLFTLQVDQNKKKSWQETDIKGVFYFCNTCVGYGKAIIIRNPKNPASFWNFTEGYMCDSSGDSYIFIMVPKTAENPVSRTFSVWFKNKEDRDIIFESLTMYSMKNVSASRRTTTIPQATQPSQMIQQQQLAAQQQQQLAAQQQQQQQGYGMMNPNSQQQASNVMTGINQISMANVNNVSPANIGMNMSGNKVMQSAIPVMGHMSVGMDVSQQNNIMQGNYLQYQSQPILGKQMQGGYVQQNVISAGGEPTLIPQTETSMYSSRSQPPLPMDTSLFAQKNAYYSQQQRRYSAEQIVTMRNKISDMLKNDDFVVAIMHKLGIN